MQVRECTTALLHKAKRLNVPVFVVGHVTKQGDIAGPRVLEHIVDVVLYLEGERFQSFRILRPIKNRHGPVDEVIPRLLGQLGHCRGMGRRAAAGLDRGGGLGTGAGCLQTAREDAEAVIAAVLGRVGVRPTCAMCCAATDVPAACGIPLVSC